MLISYGGDGTHDPAKLYLFFLFSFYCSADHYRVIKCFFRVGNLHSDFSLNNHHDSVQKTVFSEACNLDSEILAALQTVVVV